ncbi:MAG: hypothetical protein JNM89_01615 [Hyphomicrobiaceae bacterium]|nr:hypothetical protein [Hyphomicrobiaceae bacterium]
MHEFSRNTAELRDSGRRFSQLAFGLLALAALLFALSVHNSLLPVELEAEARRIIAWSFVGLSALDAALLLVWERFIGAIARG